MIHWFPGFLPGSGAFAPDDKIGVLHSAKVFRQKKGPGMVARCPHCGVVLDEDFLATQGPEFYCPECDRPVRQAQIQGTEAGAQLPGAEPSGPEAASLEEEGSGPAEEPISDAPPPGRLECVQKDRQLVILILPGSNRVVRSLGCMAVVWLGIVGLVTTTFLQVAIFGGGLAWEAAPLVIMFGIVFWGVGLAMLYFWLLGRFGKTYVLVEPDRVVIRRVLFGRERLQEYALGADSQARLVESYRQNNQPVYKVAIRTASGKSASFGTFLSDEEKRWLVARINQHLGVPVRLKSKGDRRHRPTTL